MIKASALSKSFRRQDSRKEWVQAVRDVSFEAGDAQITGLLGPNGAGKSTTLRMLASLIQPDSGSAEIDGFDVAESPLEVRRQIGFLPHNSGLYPRLTARENIEYYAELCGLDARRSRLKTEELVERLSMRGFADRRAEGFSQGQRTKVALGRALIHEPRTLILDEPTNGLDVMATRQLRGILRQLRDEGHCILLSSHIMQEVSMLCDHIAIISDGQVAVADSIDGIRERTGQADLEDAFVVAIGGTLEDTE